MRAAALSWAAGQSGVGPLGVNRDVLHGRALRARVADADRPGVAADVDVDPPENMVEGNVRLLLAPDRLLLAGGVEPRLRPDPHHVLRAGRIIETLGAAGQLEHRTLPLG